MSKVIILMGRGIEGTGNTRFTIELMDNIEAAGNDVKIIANNEKKWGRRESQENRIIEYNFKKREIQEIEADVDYVIITSVPAKNYSDEGKGEFLDFIKNHRNNGAKIVYIQVDHKIHSIARNMYRAEEYMYEFFNNIDLVVTHDLRNDFNQKFVVRHKIEINVIERLCIGADMEEFKHVRKHASEKIDKSIYFIGRSAGWKGWMVLRDLHFKHLKDQGYSTVIEGIELSIGVLAELYTQTKPERIPREDIVLKFNQNDQLDVLKSGEKSSAYIYGPYVRNEALERLSQSKFGFFGTFMGEQFGGPLENTMLEIVNAGTMIIIRKELYDCASFNGKYMNEFTPMEMGIIVYDEADPEKLIKELDYYNSNDEAYAEAAERSLKFFKENFDTKILISNIWSGIKENA